MLGMIINSDLVHGVHSVALYGLYGRDALGYSVSYSGPVSEVARPWYWYAWLSLNSIPCLFYWVRHLPSARARKLRLYIPFSVKYRQSEKTLNLSDLGSFDAL